MAVRSRPLFLAREEGDDLRWNLAALEAAVGLANGPDAGFESFDGQIGSAKQLVMHVEAAAPPANDPRLDEDPIAERRGNDEPRARLHERGAEDLIPCNHVRLGQAGLFEKRE